MCLKINNDNKQKKLFIYVFIYLFFSFLIFFYFLTKIYTWNFGKWNMSFLNLSILFLTFINVHFINREDLLVLALLYKVCSPVSKWQFEIFSTFFVYCIYLANMISTLSTITIFAQILTIYNGNTVCLFSIVKKNIYSSIHSHNGKTCLLGEACSALHRPLAAIMIASQLLSPL